MAEQNDQIDGKRFDTRAILAGQEYDQWTNNELIPPIVTTTTFFQADPTDIKVNCSSFPDNFALYSISILFQGILL